MARRPEPRRSRPAVPQPKKADIVHTSIYLPRSAWRALREIAAKEDVKVHDLFIEGVDAILKRHGMASISEMKKGRN